MKSLLPRANRLMFGVAAVYIALYFCWFVRGSLRAQFTHDDLMNTYGAFARPYPSLVADNLIFFRFAPNYRPFGALVYKVFFDWFGFNLYPLRLLLFLTLGANACLLYLSTRRLTGSREAGLLAALILSYHASFSMLYYNTGTLYDIFCFFFYFWALAYYLRIRQGGRYLNPLRMLGFCALFVLALDSKEMAVTLPVMVGLYELLYHRPQSFRPGELIRWMGHEGLTAGITAVMTPAFVLGRMTGPTSLPQIGGYRITLSLGEYLTRTGQYLDPLFYADGWFTPGRTALFLLLLFAVAWVSRSPALRFCALLFAVGLLPIAFIPPRAVHAAYIPVAGLAIFVAILLTAGRGRLAGLAARPPSVVTAVSQAVLFVLVAWFLLRVHPTTEGNYVAWQPEYGLIRSVREQMAQLHPRMPRGGRMLIVTDPFGKFDWASLFIGRLLYRDATLTVDRVAKLDPKPNKAAVATYDVILTYQDGRLVDLKPSEVRITP